MSKSIQNATRMPARSFVRQSMVVAILVIAFSGGCSRKPNPNVLAKVGAREITVQDFNQEVQWYVKNRRPLPDKATLLEQMIARELRLQKAKAAGLENDYDVRRRYDAMLAGKIEEIELKPQVDGIKPSPAEVQAIYEKERAHHTRPAQTRLALICIKTDRKITPEKLAEAESRVNEARKLAIALPPGTTGFGSVAADYSEDQASRYRGGDVGWFEKGRSEYRWPTEVVRAGFSVQKGQISDVIQTTNGFYLVTQLDSRPEVLTPLDQVRNLIERRLIAEKRQQVEAEFNQKLRSHFPVESNPEVLVRVQYPAAKPGKTEEAAPPMLPSTTVSSNGKPSGY